MITFLPTSDFKQSVSMLDSKRLGNQRVEARMILRWLRNPVSYPRHQTAGYTVMWKGYEDALCLYYNACLDEFARRGGQNIVCQPEPVPDDVKMPPWLNDDELHKTHRSALLYKLPEHYKQYGWGKEISDPKVDYLWPRPIDGGKLDDYELCPAFWKKKKTKSSPTKTTQSKKVKAVASNNAKKPRRKETPAKRGSSSVKNNITALDDQSRYPSRRPRRRSPRLSK